jgi:hypothetical protein
MTTRITLITLLVLALLPSLAFAQTGFSRDGIFGCNAAQYGGSPGTTAAIGGVFVPVSDAAVTLNTGVLVYKECVLDGVAIRMREAATAAAVRSGILAFLKGRTSTDAAGNLVEEPLYPVDLQRDILNERDRATAQALQKGSFDNLNPLMREEIRRAVARGYYQSTRKPGDALLCPYDDLENALKGTPKSMRDALYHLQNPACTPLGAYQIASAQVAAAGDRATSDMLLKLSWSGGVYDKSIVDANGTRITQTPGRFVASSQEQFLQSGFRQQEQASGIDGMISALFAGISSEIIRSSQGLSGLAQSSGGQPSYLDQVNAAAQQGLRTAANNAAIAIIRDAQMVEKAYGDVMRAILERIILTQSNLREAERLCWSNIAERTCTAGSLKADGTCTSSEGTSLKVATSTIYSQVAINKSTIFGQQTTVAENVKKSDNALKVFASMIESFNGNTSQSAQLQAQLQLDSLVSQNVIHKKEQVDTAIQQQRAIDASIDTSMNQIKAQWNGDASDGTVGVVPWNGKYPPTLEVDIVGWCNYGNADTITKWSAKWKK